MYDIHKICLKMLFGEDFQLYIENSNLSGASRAVKICHNTVHFVIPVNISLKVSSENIPVVTAFNFIHFQRHQIVYLSDGNQRL